MWVCLQNVIFNSVQNLSDSFLLPIFQIRQLFKCNPTPFILPLSLLIFLKTLKTNILKVEKCYKIAKMITRSFRKQQENANQKAVMIWYQCLVFVLVCSGNFPTEIYYISVFVLTLLDKFVLSLDFFDDLYKKYLFVRYRLHQHCFLLHLFFLHTDRHTCAIKN